MCGIAGMLSSDPGGAALVRRMTAALWRRGPDDEGVWADPAAGVALGHRRLAIVDPSAAGHQPMVSHNRRYVLACNGEIYNHAAIRRMLEASGTHAWRGRSDSETLLEAIACWGLERALRESAGMFALALWDRDTRTLFLARDRFGEKPLYYGRVGRDFLFASELKALRLHPDFAAPIDREALALFAARGYVPTPRSIFQGITKLEPGTILAVRAGGLTEAAPRPFWSYRKVVEAGLCDPLPDRETALKALGEVLSRSVREQATADVPAGAFLSGGIDSSLVIALWSRHAARPVRTYTMGFEEGGFDEAPYARRVAEAVGADHTECYVTAAEARDVIPSLPGIYDEPLADPSQIPTYLLSALARAEVKVALSGDGGDELFGGYTRYLTAADTWRRMDRVPRGLRRAIGAGLGRVPPGAWDRLAALSPRGPKYPGARLQRTCRRLETVGSLAELYTSFRDEWAGLPSPVIGDEVDCRLDLDVAGAGDLVRMMYCDAVSYLPGDILCKVDRATMAHGLEVRIPFLDHRVAALAARIPIDMKISGGTGKNILRQMLFRLLPASLFTRPKAGFSVPVGAWLKGPLRPWAEEMLARDRLDREGLLDGAMIERRWRDHLAGRMDGTFSLWAVLMFQAWSQAPAASATTDFGSPKTGTYG